MVNGSTLDLRIGRAHEYLCALAASFERPWAEAVRQARAGEDWLPLLALAHPDHYKECERYLREYHVQRICPVRGARSFEMEVGLDTLACAAERIWGYACPIARSDKPAADHLFPFSLGGPTLASNKVHLCRWHNQIKAADIHVYPWELGQPPWLDDVLKRISRFM